jgi:hypothetical protein
MLTAGRKEMNSALSEGNLLLVPFLNNYASCTLLKQLNKDLHAVMTQLEN